MKNKLILTIFFLLPLIYGCEKKENIVNEESISSDDLFKISDPDFDPQPPSSIYFIDQVVIADMPSGPSQVPPEDYFINTEPPLTGWKINDAGDKFVAYGSAESHFETAFGDLGGENSEAHAQVMLVKNNQIYLGKSVYDMNYATFSGTEEKATAETGNVEFEFSFDTDLTGVSIVSQGYLWGCFATNTAGKSVAIVYASDTRILFNLTIPDPDPPSPPANLSIDEASIILTWDASENTDSYNIYKSIDSNSWLLLDTTTDTSYRDWSVIKLPDVYTFSYKVQAVNSYGSYNLFSNVVSTMGNTFY